MKKATLYLHPNQIGKYIKGTELLKHFEDNDMLKDMMTIEELEQYVKDNPKETEEWKNKYICAWKSTFKDSKGNLCVRYLCWDGSKWGWVYRYLDDVFNSFDPAAILASSSQVSEPDTLPSDSITFEEAVKIIKRDGWTITLTK